MKAAGTSKGNVSEPNPISNSEAQTPPIDYTKPLNVILPSPQPLSSSESTSSDYSTDSSELLRKSSKYLNKTHKKTPMKKAPFKRTLKKTKNNPPEETIVIDTSILDHLTTHLSGDAFTHSNLNSPNHPINKFVNTTSEPPQEPPVQEPPITIVQTPPQNFVASEQEKPPISEQVIQDEIMTHCEPHIASPKPSEQPSQHSPKHTTEEPAETIAEQEHHISTEPNPAENQNIEIPPSTPLIHGPNYKPLTVDELILPADFALPIQERIMKEAIDIDDEPRTLSLSSKQTVDISKIKIIPLKRKRSQPTIPFNRNHPFLNPIS
ncbi:hypothetical protein QL285_009889 [Trifolium repens]|nr:hypothetical protein QL285_009889 [Trifolium repens]